MEEALGPVARSRRDPDRGGDAGFGRVHRPDDLEGTVPGAFVCKVEEHAAPVLRDAHEPAQARAVRREQRQRLSLERRGDPESGVSPVQNKSVGRDEREVHGWHVLNQARMEQAGVGVVRGRGGGRGGALRK